MTACYYLSVCLHQKLLDVENPWNSSDRRECYRCGSSKHLADACIYKNKECFGCKRTGHVRRKCPNTRKKGKFGKFGVGVNRVPVIESDEEEVLEGVEGMNMLSLYTLVTNKSSGRKHEPVIVTIGLNGRQVGMEIYTGAAVSVISAANVCKLGESELSSSDLNLKTYTGEVVRPKGVGEVKVTYKDQELMIPITVVEGNVPTLLGRDWLCKLKLSWGKLFPVNVNSLKVDERIDSIQRKYPNVFSGKLGCLKDFKVHIPVPSDVRTRVIKARSVPYALRARVDEELDKLEEQGVWRKVEYSKWAAPIVPVLKNSRDPSGPVGICGDYKTTVNQVAPCDSYPIPNTSEQLATLAGGEKFTKIDLSQAYQQLELDEPSRKLLTINTHRGLYQPQRLQFGVHSTTGIFQREVDKRLTGIPNVKVRVVYILVTGKNDMEHLNNLERLTYRGFLLRV